MSGTTGDKPQNAKLWGGRFAKATAPEVERFTSSFAVDRRLWEADLRGSIAHARMLGKTGVLTPEESDRIVSGLEALRREIGEDPTKLGAGASNPEDVHSEIENLLRARIGPLAGKLHTARSRNDQVATATRLYLRDELDGLLEDTKALQALLIARAEGEVDTILPGLTHVQHAQPVSLAHHLLAYFWMLERDRGRIAGARARVNISPLGAAALAGTSFPIDRAMTAAELGFDSVAPNSLDAVSDRDFVCETLSACALVMSHLSRLSEELILWSTPEFGFVELDDSVTTGSSIMPQKKNPDVAELIRGKSGRVTGALMGALTMLKGLPLAYNRDLQEDKTFLFDGIDTTRASLALMRLMLETARFNPKRMQGALARDFSNATDLADDLVRAGMEFRNAHEVVGGIVQHCIGKQIGLEDLNLPDLQRFSPLFGKETLERISHRSVMTRRTSEGGTAPEAVRAQLRKAREAL